MDKILSRTVLSSEKNCIIVFSSYLSTRHRKSCIMVNSFETVIYNCVAEEPVIYVTMYVVTNFKPSDSEFQENIEEMNPVQSLLNHDGLHHTTSSLHMVNPLHLISFFRVYYLMDKNIVR